MRPPDLSPPPSESTASSSLDGAPPEKRKKKKKKKGKKKAQGSGPRVGTSRGVETMFRTSYMTHVNLSSLADSKANIMISINGIIMSIIIASISPKIDTNPWLLLPTSVLLVSCMVSIVYAVLAARPRLSKTAPPEQASLAREALAARSAEMKQKASILFFGQFATMQESEFVDSMLDLLENLDDLYESMIRDIYNLGKVLARKFALLRVSYMVFMIGLALGVVLYIFAFAGVALNPPAGPASPVP